MDSECQVSPAVREQSVRHGRRLEYYTLVWCLAEAAGGLAAGLVAGSIALVGFGADSVIEMASGAILLWRLADPAAGESRERTARRLVGACFLALAAYIAYDAITSLIRHQIPDVSFFGIGFSCLCLIVMPLLARAKRRAAVRLDSGAMHADSRQSDFCAWLAAILLAGLALNATLGWWWADPVSALAMVPLIAREGVGALRGRPCGCC